MAPDDSQGVGGWSMEGGGFTCDDARCGPGRIAPSNSISLLDVRNQCDGKTIKRGRGMCSCRGVGLWVCVRMCRGEVLKESEWLERKSASTRDDDDLLSLGCGRASVSPLIAASPPPPPIPFGLSVVWGSRKAGEGEGEGWWAGGGGCEEALELWPPCQRGRGKVTKGRAKRSC